MRVYSSNSRRRFAFIPKNFGDRFIQVKILYQRRFETTPRRGVMVQTETGNLVEVSSTERIEIFNGVIHGT